MKGCPSCGADRLKAAPVPIVDALLSVLVRRRRYRCVECAWVGWRHRLRRHTNEPSSQRSTQASAAVLIGFIAVVLLIGGGLLMESCGEQSASVSDGGSQ